MKLRIRHDTTYRYRNPVELETHRLMLMPRNSHDLRILSNSVRIAPHAEVEWTQDVFGNLVASAHFSERTSQLCISTDILVEQHAPAWPVFRIAPVAHSYPFRYSDEEIADLGAHMKTHYPDDGGKFDQWVQGFVYGTGTDTLSLLKDVNTGIGDAIAYRVRDEAGTQAPLETLSLGSGSCRDMAALFIDAVRHLGFGARAVSGYLYDPDQPASDPGSTHAWAEVYLPSAGWIAFDPTHRRVGSANLIAVAAGRCNKQIMPVAGGFIGAAEDFIDMDVRVSVASA
ncbi:Transglutaminase [Sphingobium herbicidovorans NBRC 16415]|uniref:Transglutaminase n=1 Tax=Sphingobium herbicidovorans (strain ATCC 700291 / DSM 11019 / CCUG 56400 / KCTC 2939 / LMG 18315 / NBRC 16415 / MH) TaxID=1219045 RepID=A0A086PA27_SPHHM|nr:transglutaminase family protein [Sphingobium herbicidovorans]KFG90245.1 Transglutaminase [Sphingobium herbicidovorans NBRC 16415]